MASQGLRGYKVNQGEARRDPALILTASIELAWTTLPALLTQWNYLGHFLAAVSDSSPFANKLSLNPRNGCAGYWLLLQLPKILPISMLSRGADSHLSNIQEDWINQACLGFSGLLPFHLFGLKPLRILGDLLLGTCGAVVERWHDQAENPTRGQRKPGELGRPHNQGSVSCSFPANVNQRLIYLPPQWRKQNWGNFWDLHTSQPEKESG